MNVCTIEELPTTELEFDDAVDILLHDVWVFQDKQTGRLVRPRLSIAAKYRLVEMVGS